MVDARSQTNMTNTTSTTSTISADELCKVCGGIVAPMMRFDDEPRREGTPDWTDNLLGNLKNEGFNDLIDPKIFRRGPEADADAGVLNLGEDI